MITATDVLGQPVNLAARVTESAGGGQVIVTEALAEAAGPLPGLCYVTAGTKSLRGITEPVRLCQVLCER